MRITTKITGGSDVERMLKRASKLTGKGIDVGIREMGKSTARALANKVQPYGMSVGIGRRFMKNIQRQVEQVWIGVNLGAYPATNDIEQAHKAARRNGVVRPRKFRKERGNYWRNLISREQVNRYIDKQQSKAGRAKAAWIEAGDDLKVGKVGRIAKWISRHLGGGYGKAIVTKSGLNTNVTLDNRTPYISKLQTSREIRTALQQGRKNGVKRLQYIIEAELKKAQQ